MRQIHSAVEQNRGASIPDWAYRDVLFMLVHYSIASYELLEKKLSHEEKEEVYNLFYRVGARMGLKELPLTYNEWLPVRNSHLMEDLQKSEYTADLFRQYKKHLGAMRFKILIEGDSKKTDKDWMGRSSQNKVVVFPKGNTDLKPGDYVDVKVYDCTQATLLGELIN